ncbi:hypothetical protein [Streptomyces sp. AP-93]|uniref:hypothetical protein n=1 Tax=Streptomyces sp. AP-93 TaxID=2929048 RepID=UPI001FB0290D|nr:hypothetical protein [Streptomyces sp. AP-93]MCJ0874091.1 hypothetical protein [Streptomyces sp. AP-93]
MLVHAGQGSLAAHHIGQVTYQAAARRAVSWPHQVGVIPRRAGSFQHRAEVQRLRSAVEGGGTAVLCQVLAGMGGVGKTQLAADRARQLADLLPEPNYLPDDQPTTAAAAWLLSLDRANELRPAGPALPMLRLAAMLDPNGIPDRVLTSDPVRTYLAAHRAFQQGGSPPPRPLRSPRRRRPALCGPCTA